MDKEHIKEHLDRGGRTFIFEDKVTYIEKQEITVQSGANFYNGPGMDDSDKVKVEQQNAQQSQTVDDVPPMSVEDKLRYCIAKLEADAFINFKQDYAVLNKVIKDKGIKYFTNESFATFVSANESVPANHKPSESNIKMLTFHESKYPNIKVAGVDADKNLYYKTLADKFWEIYDGLK